MASTTHHCIHVLRLTGAVLTCTVAAGALAGCSSGAPKRTASSPSVAVSSTPSVDPDQAAQEMVLASYTNMREIQIKMASDGDLHTVELAKYARGGAATDLKKSVLRNESMGIKFTGRPEMKPRVTAVDTKGRSATVTDCFDATNWKPVYKDSGKELKLAAQRLKYPVTSQATLEGDTWFVTKITADRSKGC